MSKTWKSRTGEEKLAVGAKLKAIYEKYGNPEWLKNPEQNEEIVYILNEGETEHNNFLTIKGEASIENKDQAAEIAKEIKEALSEVLDLKV